MSKHNDIYNILGKLAALQPAPAKPQSVLKELTESAAPANPHSLKDRLTKQLAETTVAEGRADVGSSTVKSVYYPDKAQSPIKKSAFAYDAQGETNFKKYPDQTSRPAGMNPDPASAEVDEDMLTPKQKKNIDKNHNGKIDGQDFKMLRKGKVDEAEERKMSRAAKGYEKYGKEGMQALAKAGKEGKDLDKVRDKYNKYKDDVKESAELNEAYINNVNDAVNILANLRAMGKQSERGGQVPPGFANQVVNDLYDVMTWIQNNMQNQQVTEGVYKDTTTGKDYEVVSMNMNGDWEVREVGSDKYAPAKIVNKATQSRFQKISEGEYQDAPNKSDIPAAQRKAKAVPGDDSWKTSQQDLDDEASKSPTGSAGLAKAKARLGMNEVSMTCDEDDGDAYAKLPAVRKTAGHEHQEYERAAQTFRKWMRKRGWDTKKEMKHALKYVMDNLDSTHDDTLTPEVKEACQCCMKHRDAVSESGLDMNLLKRAQGGMKGVNTDPESERNSGKKYGYRNDRDDTGNDDDYDEHGNEKKKVAKKSSTGPAKQGRPKKNFGPERTTAKAYKHKGERVSENVNLSTFVEDTMSELDAIIVNEKDMGKHNNATTGFKALAKKAGGGEKGDKIAGAQFQKMKKAGQLEEGVREHPIYTDKEAWDHYKKEMDEEKATEIMAKPDLTITPSTGPMAGPVPSQDHELSELAKLAGLGSSQVTEASCNKTEGGVMCPVHGMSECWSGGMMEAKDEKADKDYDNDGEVESGKDEYLGSKIAAAKKAGKLKESETCSTCDCDPCECDDDKDSKKVDENLSLLRMLAGIKEAKKAKPDFLDMDKDGNKKESMKSAVNDKKKVDEWANEPNENYAKVDTIIKQGGDLNKSKKQDPKTANKAANPLKEHVKAVEQRLAKIYDSIKVK
jgi:hypothetical protein